MPINLSTEPPICDNCILGKQTRNSVPKICVGSKAARKLGIIDLDELHQFLQEEISHAQEHYEGPADAKHKPTPDFKIGDQVFIKAQYFRIVT
jgi:hypothetical protein